MSELTEFIVRFAISEEDALQALLGAMSPIQPPALRQNWLVNKRFGNAAPSTKEIWQLFVDADFRCTKCRSQRRITLDHIDRDPTNHNVNNLRVLCASCNRAENKKSTQDEDHQLKIYRAALALFKELGRFPTDRQILERAGTKQIGGATYFLRYMKMRFEPNAQQLAPAGASQAPQRRDRARDCR